MFGNSNDNGRVRADPGDEPHGRAALLLVESLIHSLIATSVLDLAEAVNVVNRASEVEREHLNDAGVSSAGAGATLRILSGIEKSLALDLEPQ